MTGWMNTPENVRFSRADGMVLPMPLMTNTRIKLFSRTRTEKEEL